MIFLIKNFFNISIIYLIFFNITFASEQNAWLPSWNYRTPILVSNIGIELVNHQLSIDIDLKQRIEQNKIKDNCGDIRFTDSDGTTLLNYWIENFTDPIKTPVKIWIKIPSIPNGNQTIYFYHGNITAISESSITNTFDFYENFDGNEIDSSKWTSTGDSVINFNNGVFESSGQRLLTTKTYQSNSNMIIELYANIESQWECDVEIGWINSEKSWRWTSWTSGGYKSSNGSSDYLGKWANSGWNIYSIVREGTKAHLFINDNEYPASPQQMDIIAGNYFLRIMLDNTSRSANNMQSIDWIRIRKYTSSEPTLILQSEESNTSYIAEREALIDIYNSTNGDDWSINTNWLGEIGSECTWFGVICDESKHVESLHLFSNNLNGSIPSSLINLTYLKSLLLHNNNITGSIPNELLKITTLESITFNNNKLDNTIISLVNQIIQDELSKWDVNNDNVIGIEEAIYALQISSGLLTKKR